MKILTIIIPTYNMERYLDRCLSSLVIEDSDLMRRVEVLIVNDGSTDGSSLIGHKYQQDYPDTFRVIDKENGNYGSCINRGLAEAQGKYLKVLDADDYFDNNNYHQFLHVLSTTDVDCFISDMEKVSDCSTEVNRITFNLPINQSFGLKDLGLAAWNLWMHCVCLRTENLQAIHYHQTEGISYTDQEFICLPMSTARSIMYFPHVVYNYLVNRSGQTVDPMVWEKNFEQELIGTKVMISQEHCLYPGCTDEGHAYIKTRIAKRVEVIYIAYFTKFKTFDNNRIMVEFDRYLQEQDPILYKAQERNRLLKVIRYVSHWRKDYKANTFYLRMVRKLADIVHNIKYGI